MDVQNSTCLVEEYLNGPDIDSDSHSLVVTSHTAVLVVTVQMVFICGIICLFGIVANIVNMFIFVKQGLDNTVNISLFSLAVSDFCSLVTLEWTAICNNPLVINSAITVDTAEIMYITGGWPHACFGHIACWITAYITAERCLCIALPLKVKDIITPRRTSIIICALYFVNITAFIQECTLVYVDYRFYPSKNRSLFTLALKEDRGTLGGMPYILLAILGTACFPAVILFTSILVTKLRHQAQWRLKSTKNNNQTDPTAKRETKTMMMVALVAAILIVCYTPGILASVACFIDPSFSLDGDKAELFLMICSGIFIFEAFNSSINIFLYYRMSTKYKKTFHEVLGACVHRRSTTSNLLKAAGE